ncbi:DUF2911 domain-containing protein [Rubrivirga sp. IMCC45206]|uniref:DUF2911 domain-containing protein n=1 Tax=Rubrivirga sp. IMCC45206 TaxID=3391614 RepID=UPI0039901AFF
MLRPLALALLTTCAATAQHAHPAPVPAEATAVAETFVVTGLRLDEAAPPPGSAVGRAGLRYGDGGYASVVFGRPFVRGRAVWGGLVADGTVWAAGAHRATELVTTVPLAVGGVEVPPGAYSLFVTPGPDAWTLHVNASLGAHLADEYDPALDLVTVTVAPHALDATVEGLTWSFDDDGAALVLAWDRRAAAFPITRLP